MADVQVGAVRPPAELSAIIKSSSLNTGSSEKSSLGNQIELFNRGSSESSVSESEGWRLDADGEWMRTGSAESAFSTSISSICSSIVHEQTVKSPVTGVENHKKRMLDGSPKTLSPRISPRAASAAEQRIDSLISSQPLPSATLPKKRGRPPKANTTGASATAKPAWQAKSMRTPKSTFMTTQIRPRSSIPSQLPADVFASQCVDAAYASRLSPYALHVGEHMLLKDRLGPKEVTVYLNIRNRILRLWKQNPLCRVTADEATGCAKDTRYFRLADIAYRWLVRNGFINFGCVEVLQGVMPHKAPSKELRQRTVVVVGAGVSGLTAARQLEGLFAHEAGTWSRRGERPPRVIVLEGRQRVGGRVYSKPLRSQVKNSLPDDLRNTAEMGAMIVTGFEHGNPLDTIIRAQLGIRYHLMRDSLTIYDCDGRPVEERRDILNTELYTDISDRAGDFRALPKKHDTLQGDSDLINRGRDPPPDGSIAADLEPLVAGQIKSHQPAARRGRRRNAPPGTEKITGRTEVVEGKSARLSAARTAKDMGWMLKEGVSKNQTVSMQQVACATSNPTLGSVMDDTIVQYQDLISLTPTDMRLLNWHHANLEYANAAPVTSLSLSGHDQDTGNEFEGAHSEVIGGYTQVPRGLMNLPTKLDVRFEHEVESIHYDDRHPSNGRTNTRITCSNGEVFEADEVVLTTPLGVLKHDSIDFDPPLPSWKQGAIDRMGFGLLNKVILLYEKPFWDDERDMFGLLNEPEKHDSLDPKDYETRRGRFYLIWNASKTSGRPMLIALMAGHAAYEAEYTATSILMDEVTGRLKGVFGPAVPQPLEVIVTRWRQDRFTRGTYSYVAPDTQPGDYDIMAKPVGNLHFAGEATCGTHPATVHGALLSGLRVASDVVGIMAGALVVPDTLVATNPLKQASTVRPAPGRLRGDIHEALSPSQASAVSGQIVSNESPDVVALATVVKHETEGEISISSIPAARTARAHFVMQPAAPPVRSVCPTDSSFWISSKAATTAPSVDPEATIVTAILTRIGDRPPKPSRQGVNPFLLFTKDKWEDCKKHCNDIARTTSPSNASTGRDVIRQTLGKWWKSATEAEKAPYRTQSQAAQHQADLIRKEWEGRVAQWDIDAARIRREHTSMHSSTSDLAQATQHSHPLA